MVELRECAPGDELLLHGEHPAVVIKESAHCKCPKDQVLLLCNNHVIAYSKLYSFYRAVFKLRKIGVRKAANVRSKSTSEVTF